LNGTYPGPEPDDRSVQGFPLDREVRLIELYRDGAGAEPFVFRASLRGSGRVNSVSVDAQLKYVCSTAREVENFFPARGGETWYDGAGRGAIRLRWAEAFEQAERFCASRKDTAFGGSSAGYVLSVRGTVTATASASGGDPPPFKVTLNFR
jgi:hypothetical protein